MGNDLTTLAHVKSWLKVDSVDADRDRTLERLIRAQSRFIEAWLSRIFLSQLYVEVRDGFGAGAGRYSMMFGNEPVSTVSSVVINGIAIPASPDGGVRLPGYGFDSDELWIAPLGPVAGFLSNNEFTRGRRNVSLQYTGGFLVLPLTKYSSSRWLLPAEQQVIPPTPWQIIPDLLWLADNGVQFVADGTSLVAVTSAPSAGQYSVATLNGVPGVYTFSGADVGKTVALSYSYVPSDVEQSCIELVGLRWKEKDRIGVVRLGVGTESTEFYQKDMPAQVATDLQQYKRTFVL